MIIVNEKSCPQNHPCPLVYHCPVGAITQKGYGLPVIDQEKCVDCGICLRACPYRAMQVRETAPV